MEPAASVHGGVFIEAIWLFAILGALCLIIGAGLTWFFVRLDSDLRDAQDDFVDMKAAFKAMEAKVGVLENEVPITRKELSDIRDAILRLVPRRNRKHWR